MSPVDGEVLRANGMKTVAKYIVCRKGVIMQWVALRPIFSVSAWEKGFEGGGGVEETVLEERGSG